LALFLPTFPAFGADLGGKWVLSKSELTYRVTHPLHKVAGKSTAARGKGVCGAKGCEFIVAVPVKSFDSGDGNRDSHMWQTVKAGLYPLIQVKITNIQGVVGSAPKEVTMNAQVEFAGKKVSYPKIKLEVMEWKKEGVHLKGILPLTLKAFDITAPSL